MAKRSTRTPITLEALTAPKAAESRPAAADASARRGLTLRLSPESWKQLRRLALDEETTAHALILEGLNHVFRSRGLPKIES